MKPAEPGPTSNLALIDTGNWAQTLCSHAHPTPSLPLQTHTQTLSLRLHGDHGQRLHSLLPLTHCRPVHQLPPSILSAETQHLLGKIAAHTAGRTRPDLAPERAHPVGLLLVRGRGPTPRTPVSPPCLPHPALDPHVLLQERHRVMK